MIIVVDRNLCIGAAPCVAVAGDVFQLDDEGKAIVINPKGADEKTIKLAAEACPVRAIFLYDEKTKKQIYPSTKEISRPYKKADAA
jgi:ferredoxin